MSEDKLFMKFEANTIQHLGVKMYSTMPPALAELIANAYDACATEVYIKLYDRGEKKVIVQDDGTGMSFDEVNNYFLRIGRNRREEKQESQCGRIPTGKKGLGKLALFGIGDKIMIVTSQEKETVRFDLNWNEILDTTGKDYEPSFERFENSDNENGTIITLNDLRRKTGFPIEDYADNIAKLFNFPDDFVIYISLNDETPIRIDNKTKYQNIDDEFQWDFQGIVDVNEKEYKEKKEIKGSIITTEKPLKPNLRGITLFANGRMVNMPEFFGPSESSHFYSYATGWLNVDFIDNWEEDVISTNRQSIDWENSKTSELREYLASCLSIIERKWRELRKEKKQNAISEKVSLNVGQWIERLPENVQSQVEGIVNLLDDTPELSEDTQQRAIHLIHNLVPEYANLHWRYLHPEIRKAAEADYIKNDFYRAFIEAVKRYINLVRTKSKSTNTSDNGMMGSEFGLGKVLQVAAKFNKPDGSKFDSDTYKCIEEGQKYLSMGIVSGARNPISHEEIRDLRDSQLFTEKDCLDMLSLLSHLFKRLEDADPAP
ncbi:TIGR02391 family protein [Chryseobacterium paludis]|uniref:TIGR02391 family protein n=1 Tax=Chryseobacterium paludis TaxID=2956784 RepID=UPI0021C1D34E|nr:TIGR02391 family protein [Chryseobacterium paludis]